MTTDEQEERGVDNYTQSLLREHFNRKGLKVHIGLSLSRDVMFVVVIILFLGSFIHSFLDLRAGGSGRVRERTGK